MATLATVYYQHDHEGTQYWRPVNHTFKAWTPPEAGYGQIERKSNGIFTGMHMNKMYTLGTNIEVITDLQPLISYQPMMIRPNQSNYVSIDIEQYFFLFNTAFLMRLIKRLHVIMDLIILLKLSLLRNRLRTGASKYVMILMLIEL